MHGKQKAEHERSAMMHKTCLHHFKSFKNMSHISVDRHQKLVKQYIFRCTALTVLIIIQLQVTIFVEHHMYFMMVLCCQNMLTEQ
jgi:hypothetical protein